MNMIMTHIKARSTQWLCAAAITLGALLSPNAHAAGSLLYIQPFEYTNPILLWRFSQQYWFEQGPVVEKIALEKFGQHLGNVSMCEGNQTGNMLIWLQPEMFYNPQLQLFFGEIEAKVYTGIGQLVATYVGKAHVSGLFDVAPDKWIEQSYAQAMDKLIANMQADSKFTGLQSAPATEPSNTPCSMVTLLPVPKVRATSF